MQASGYKHYHTQVTKEAKFWEEMKLSLVARLGEIRSSVHGPSCECQLIDMNYRFQSGRERERERELNSKHWTDSLLTNALAIETDCQGILVRRRYGSLKSLVF